MKHYIILVAENAVGHKLTYFYGAFGTLEEAEAEAEKHEIFDHQTCAMKKPAIYAESTVEEVTANAGKGGKSYRPIADPIERFSQWSGEWRKTEEQK